MMEGNKQTKKKIEESKEKGGRGEGKGIERKKGRKKRN